MDTMNAQWNHEHRPRPMINSQTYPHVTARIDDLYATAADIRAGRSRHEPTSGIVSRTRITIGRRLITLGGALAGQGA